MLLNLERYHRPKSLGQALELLKNSAGRVVAPIAGGTHLVASQRRDVQEVVDITHLGLAYVRRTDHGLIIGATTTLQTLVESKVLVKGPHAIVAQAAHTTTTSKMRRHVATLGGELVTMSPYSDLITTLLALDAAVAVASETDRTEVYPLSQFLAQGLQHALPFGIVTDIRLPRQAEAAKAAFLRLSQIPSSPTILNAAALVNIKDGLCEKMRLVIGAAESTPVRLTLAEALLENTPLNPELIDAAVEKATEPLRPFSDTRASADYRKTVARVLARRVLHACLGEAKARSRK